MRLHCAIAGIAVLAGLCGFCAGQIMALLPPAPPPILNRADTQAGVPVVTIGGLENGVLKGSVKGDVRLFLGSKPVRAGSGGMFAVNAGTSFTVKNRVSVPAGARFVASKRGSKYYVVGTPAAERLSPGNRVYFGSAADAEQAGFRR